MMVGSLYLLLQITQYVKRENKHVHIICMVFGIQRAQSIQEPAVPLICLTL